MNKPHPFSGLRILNTRPSADGMVLSNTLRQIHAIPIDMPLLHIEPTPTAWRNNAPKLNNLHLAVFVSPNAVKCFFNTISAAEWPTSLPCLCIGPGTANALRAHHIAVISHCKHATSEELIAHPMTQMLHNQSVLLVKGERGRTVIENTLMARGAHLHMAVVYRRMPIEYPKTIMEHLWLSDGLDMILITSEEALRHLFILFGPQAKTWLCSKTFLVLSPRLATIATELGVQHIITDAYHHLVASLTDAIIKDE